MRSWKWVLASLAAVAVIGLMMAAPWSCSAASGSGPATVAGSEDHDVGATDSGSEADEKEAVPTEVGSNVTEAESDTEPSESQKEAPPVKPKTVAEKFVEAGGQKLCVAMVFALNPDWRMDACRASSDQERRDACENQRRPLAKFAEDVCLAVIEESLRLDLDPGLVLAVIERESSFGRVQWNQQYRAYEVQTDVCKLTLPKSRIVARAPGRRAGTELMTWTYGSQAPNAGSVARNRQPVRVLSEDDERVTINTCVAGEAGIMQTVPREWRSGTVIGATGERLEGTESERRARVEADPVLQVRLGCQALAEHRAMVPSEQQIDWLDWIHVYNTGNVMRGDHGRGYAMKIVRHYLDACRGWFAPDDNDPLSVRDVEDIWPECRRLKSELEVLQNGGD